jgi:hypothetical protein
METRSEWHGKVEIGIISHEGKEYAASGSLVTPEYAVGYMSKDMNEIRSWDGKHLGTARVTASWPIRSFISDRMYQVSATIDGIRYTGRTCGAEMIWRGKVSK